MGTNAFLALDTRYKSQDGTYPVVVRLTRDRRNIPIPTGERLREKDWDDHKREVKNSYTSITSVTRLNNLLQTKRKTARDIILKLEEDGKADTMSLADIKQCIVQQNTSGSFIKYTDELVTDLRRAKRFGTARWYEGTLSILKDLINGNDKHANDGKSKDNKQTLYKGKDLKFKEITYKFLMKFETRHYEDGNVANSLSAYMRAIRAIYNKAIKAGLADKEDYPFDHYKIKGEETRKLALEWPLLEKILKADLSPEDEGYTTRNYFVASYMMCGMSFIDLAYLAKENIVNGRIQYRRQKTSRLYDIKITPALQEILSCYVTSHPDSSFVFPIIRRRTSEEQDKDVLYERKKYNKQLKALAIALDIPPELMKNMTSKVIRHSFATQARLLGVPVDVIKEMLGHSSIKTTEIYLSSLPTYTLDDYNAQVTGTIG